MTTGFRLTLLCLMMLCLVTLPYSPAEFDHLLPIVGAGSWFAPHTESATDALTVSVARSMQSSARAGARQSLVLQRYIDCGQYGSTRLGESWATGCDRRLGELAGPAVTPGNSKTNTLGHHSPRKYWLKPPISKIRGFNNSL